MYSEFLCQQSQPTHQHLHLHLHLKGAVELLVQPATEHAAETLPPPPPPPAGISRADIHLRENVTNEVQPSFGSGGTMKMKGNLTAGKHFLHSIRLFKK